METIDETKLREIFDRGLTNGLGKMDGQMCIEAAVAVAMGEGLTDTPSCVADPDRRYAIRINDARWSSPEARSEALYPLALAQIGTAGKDRQAWIERVVIGTVNRVLPLVLRGRIDDELVDASVNATDLRSACVAATRAADAADAAYGAAGAATRAADAAADATRAADAACGVADAATRAASAAAGAATRAAYAAVGADAGDRILRESIRVALDSYANTNKKRGTK